MNKLHFIFGLFIFLFSCEKKENEYDFSKNNILEDYNYKKLSKTKKEINGFFSFKDAFTTYFISAIVGILISTIFNILLFNFIDPSAKDTLNEITIKYTINMMQKFGAPSSSINEAIKGMKESSPYDIDSLLKGMITSIVFSSIFGLIMAAFFKTRRSSQE